MAAKETHFSDAEHLLILRTTCRQAASGSFIMATCLGRLAVLLFLCLLRPVIEMRNLYKGFNSTAVNTARAAKNDPFPCRHKDIFITVSLQQLSFQNLSQPLIMLLERLSERKDVTGQWRWEKSSTRMLQEEKKAKKKWKAKAREKRGGSQERVRRNCSGACWQLQPVITHQGNFGDVCVFVCVCSTHVVWYLNMHCQPSHWVKTRDISFSFSKADRSEDQEMSLLPSNHVVACRVMAIWHFFSIFLCQISHFPLFQMLGQTNTMR